jgi:preprotein translocase subunit YajC
MDSWLTIGYFVVIIGIMYLVLFLPQKKKEKKTRAMLSALQVGNNIVTIGGIAGKIINIKDDEITIETSVEKTQLVLKRWAIRDVEKAVEA